MTLDDVERREAALEYKLHHLREPHDIWGVLPEYIHWKEQLAKYSIFNNLGWDYEFEEFDG